MNEKEYLNEEKYQKAEKMLTLVAVLILVIGFGIGGFLIYKGVAKPGKTNVDELKLELEKKRDELQNKGIEYNEDAKYTDGEEYDLKIITEALDPSFPNCEFTEYKENSITKDYCSAKNGIDSFQSSGLIMIGIFICFVGFTFSIFIFFIAKRRQIMAFQAQQVMPVAKEGIEEISPTIGNAAGEIAKGIKKGLNDDDEE